MVISIVVLLILAGVSISVVLGNNGVSTQASNAVIENRKASAREDVEIAFASAEADYWSEWVRDSSIVRDLAYYKGKLSAYLGIDEDKISQEGDNYKVDYGGYVFNIDSTGRVTVDREGTAINTGGGNTGNGETGNGSEASGTTETNGGSENLDNQQNSGQTNQSSSVETDKVSPIITNITVTPLDCLSVKIDLEIQDIDSGLAKIIYYYKSNEENEYSSVEKELIEHAKYKIINSDEIEVPFETSVLYAEVYDVANM